MFLGLAGGCLRVAPSACGRGGQRVLELPGRPPRPANLAFKPKTVCLQDQEIGEIVRGGERLVMQEEA